MSLIVIFLVCLEVLTMNICFILFSRYRMWDKPLDQHFGIMDQHRSEWAQKYKVLMTLNTNQSDDLLWIILVHPAQEEGAVLVTQNKLCDLSQSGAEGLVVQPGIKITDVHLGRVPALHHFHH